MRGVRASLGSVSVGDQFPVRVMAAINASPESFYKGSVATTAEEISTRVLEAIEEGADLVDVGGMSTAPYLKSVVSEEVEKSRVLSAMSAIAAALGEDEVTVSVDTVRSSVAEAALKNGAAVVNDVSGLKHDERMAKVIKERGASLLAMAHSSSALSVAPVEGVLRTLGETLKIAAKARIDERRIVIDPGIGFFRSEAATKTSSRQRTVPWYEWDAEVLANLGRLRRLGRPICVGVSRKSFIGKLAGIESPEERLSGSLAATAIAVANGAQMVRTHDVKETVQAVRVAEALRKPKESRPA